MKHIHFSILSCIASPRSLLRLFFISIYLGSRNFYSASFPLKLSRTGQAQQDHIFGLMIQQSWRSKSARFSPPSPSLSRPPSRLDNDLHRLYHLPNHSRRLYRPSLPLGQRSGEGRFVDHQAIRRDRNAHYHRPGQPQSHFKGIQKDTPSFVLSWQLGPADDGPHTDWIYGKILR